MPVSDAAPDGLLLTPGLSRAHLRRLRTYYRSAGWPCHDNLEIDLLNAGLIERHRAQQDAVAERIGVTDAGVQTLAATLRRHRQAFDAHEALVERVAKSQAAAGRLVYRGLTLRARVESAWKPCRPDVYSIRYTSVAAYACPVIHEVKVRRADLLADLKHAAKRAAYQALSWTFYYVLPEGLASLDEIPADCGVLYASASALSLGRALPQRAVELNTQAWMALARRGAEPLDLDDAQSCLGDEDPGS